MTQTTGPDGIVKWTKTDPASLVQESQSQADSIQAAFNKRERYDFVWTDASERAAQTGMVQGSRGYQVDTKAEYAYDNSVWRLAVSHVEYTATSPSLPSQTNPQAVGTWTLDSARSTDSTIVVPNGAASAFDLVYPGVYAISALCGPIGGAMGANSYILLTTANNSTSAMWTQALYRTPFSDDTSALSLTYYNTASNFRMYFYISNQSGAAKSGIVSRIRITRMA